MTKQDREELFILIKALQIKLNQIFERDSGTKIVKAIPVTPKGLQSNGYIDNSPLGPGEAVVTPVCTQKRNHRWN